MRKFFPEPEPSTSPKPDGKVRWTSFWIGKYVIEDRGFTYRIRYDGLSWLSSRKRPSCTISLPLEDLQLFREWRTVLAGKFKNGELVTYSVNHDQCDRSSLIEFFHGSIMIAGRKLRWETVPGKAWLSICDEGGAPMLIAKKPWQDSERLVDWLLYWVAEPSDENLRLAVIIAPALVTVYARPEGI